jgi:hypothetical protein
MEAAAELRSPWTGEAPVPTRSAGQSDPRRTSGAPARALILPGPSAKPTRLPAGTCSRDLQQELGRSESGQRASSITDSM